MHILLAAASLLGSGAVLALYDIVRRGGRLTGPAALFAVLGVSAGGILGGFVLAEAIVVAPLSEACAASAPCVARENSLFLQTFTELAWSDVWHISFAAGTLIFSIGALAIIGVVADVVRIWEGAMIVIAVVGIYATNTALHGDARYGLLLVFIASASIAVRLVRIDGRAIGRHRVSRTSA